MKQKPRPAVPTEKSQDDSVAALSVLWTLADTTWRIFTPVILMTALGIWADLKLGTKPWLTFAAVAFGFVLAILLVRAQLQKVTEMEKKK